MGKIIGIDLGTTNSEVAIVEAGKPTIIKSAEGNPYFPSIVAFTEDGEMLVGEAAKRQAVTNPEGTVHRIKRKMGRGKKVKIHGKEYSPEQMAEFFGNFVSEGQDKIKMQVARGRWPHLSKKPMTESVDLARVSAVREEVGNHVQLSIDANCKLSLLEAVRLARILEPLEIFWFEEPIYKNDVNLLSQMREKTSIPIAAGQNEGHKWKHLELITNDAVDIVQPDVQEQAQAAHDLVHDLGACLPLFGRDGYLVQERDQVIERHLAQLVNVAGRSRLAIGDGDQESLAL